MTVQVQALLLMRALVEYAKGEVTVVPTHPETTAFSGADGATVN
ncbi:hypothetical protein [Candidatus Aeolococcus gillhamiae]